MERKSIMALTSTQIIRNYIQNIPELKVKEKEKGTLYQQLIQLKNVDIITIKNMEDIVVAYADISIQKEKSRRLEFLWINLKFHMILQRKIICVFLSFQYFLKINQWQKTSKIMIHINI